MQPSPTSIVRHYPLALGLIVLLLPYLYNILLLPFSNGTHQPSHSPAAEDAVAETAFLSSSTSTPLSSQVSSSSARGFHFWRGTEASTSSVSSTSSQPRGYRFWGGKETSTKSLSTSTSETQGKQKHTVTRLVTRSPSTQTKTATSVKTTTSTKTTTAVQTSVRTTTATTTLHDTQTVTTAVTETETEVLEIIHEVPVEIIREVPVDVIREVPSREDQRQEGSFVIDEIDTMGWHQTTFTLSSRARGCYLITEEIYKNIPEIKKYKVGLLHLFIQHTSAALTVNENWDADVRKDMIDALDKLAPENAHYRHNAEGSDDMPAHIKAVLAGSSVSIPISGGKLAMGTWQGIYLCEFRKAAHRRTLVATIQGE